MLFRDDGGNGIKAAVQTERKEGKTKEKALSKKKTARNSCQGGKRKSKQ